MTEFWSAVAIGLVAGVLSGLFGVGGGIVMTPGLQVLLGLPPIDALATPLPVIFPTALTGAATYRSAGELDVRAAAWMALPGIAGAIVGARLTRVIDTHLLLIVTAALLAYQAVDILRGRRRAGEPDRDFRGTAWRYAGIGLTAGLVSGLLGIGGGLVMVPLLAGWLQDAPEAGARHVVAGDRRPRDPGNHRARGASGTSTGRWRWP